MEITYSNEFKNLHKIVTEAKTENNPQAQYELALVYFKIGSNSSNFKGFELLQKAIKSQIPEAIFEIGKCYQSGIGTYLNYEKAIEYYKKSAKRVREVIIKNRPPLRQDTLDLIDRYLADLDFETEGGEFAKSINDWLDEGKNQEEKTFDDYVFLAEKGDETAIKILAEYYEKSNDFKEATGYYRKYAEIQIQKYKKVKGD